VTKGVLPTSHTQLQRALAAEARSYERTCAQLDTRARKPPSAAVEAGEHDVDEDLQDDVDEAELDDELDRGD
jgi:hypothetical protein